MKFFKGLAQKNILLLGNKGCGKRSFVLQYKDGVDPTANADLPEFKVLTYKKYLNDSQAVNLNFTFDRASDELIPSSSSKTKFDLILILIDLSSVQANDDIKVYLQEAKTHFPGIDTLMIGTKSDQQLEINVFDGVISTSAKTGAGFEEFDSHLMAAFDITEEDNSCKIC